MKLRNKKTGEIKEYTHTVVSYYIPLEGGGYEIFSPFIPEEWEDYEEPREADKTTAAQISSLWAYLKEMNKRLKALEQADKSKDAIGQLPPREKFERMKQDLRDWIEKNEIEKIRVYFSESEDGQPGVMFEDKTNRGYNTLSIVRWPQIGLTNGGIYTPEELLITGEAGKE